VCVYKVPVLL